jgi:hypothetical protein
MVVNFFPLTAVVIDNQTIIVPSGPFVERFEGFDFHIGVTARD